MRDWMIFNPPADIPEDEEDSDLEKLFEKGFPYTAKTAAQIPSSDRQSP